MHLESCEFLGAKSGDGENTYTDGEQQKYERTHGQVLLPHLIDDGLQGTGTVLDFEHPRIRLGAIFNDRKPEGPEETVPFLASQRASAPDDRMVLFFMYGVRRTKDIHVGISRYAVAFAKSEG